MTLALQAPPGWTQGPGPSRLALHRTDGTRRIETRALAAGDGARPMQRAGAACSALARAMAPHARRVWVAAGPGNNGGDGLEAAALLASAGAATFVTFCGDSARLGPDALAAHAHASAAGVRFVAAPPDLGPDDLAIDALLGLGARRAPDGAIAALVSHLNGLACRVLAVDLPSGLHADTGTLLGTMAVRAHATLTLLTRKPGLYTGVGRDHAGDVWFDDLGVVPAEPDPPPDAWLQCGAAPRAPRRHAQHKGTFGEVVVVGGAAGMTGAALMAARAAQAAGAGKVVVSSVDRDGPRVDLSHPELMFQPRWWQQSADRLAAVTVVCGCGAGPAVGGVLPRLLLHAGRLVLDADALTSIANDGALRRALRSRAGRGQPSVLTPHPLEAARLAGCSTAEIQADRLGAAVRHADELQAVVVLKGSGTVVAAPSGVPVFNASGNARLATAGTGDVLAGWTGGRWAQAGRRASSSESWSEALDVAADAVFLHGAAAEPSNGPVLRAGELIDRLRDIAGDHPGLK